MKILTVFGTRPEVIKLAPVIRQLEGLSPQFQTVNVSSGQHVDLLAPFLRLFRIRVDYDLRVMQDGQSPSDVCARVLAALSPVIESEEPSLILVQGDTTTALAGALAGFYNHVPVGHVEAGLRSGNPASPYPEEMNRRLITRLATYHFAATPRNRTILISEGIDPENIFVTGNPVVDSINRLLKESSISKEMERLLEPTKELRRIVLTTHRRESFGEKMAANLAVLRGFVEKHNDLALIFPVHPNPSVMGTARKKLSGHPRIHLISPLNYEDFIVLLSRAWILVSDSGGVQEEAPTLGKPLLILRENTERPEVIESGVARLAGGDPGRLERMLEEVYSAGSWAETVTKIDNPFGQGDSGQRIVDVLARVNGSSELKSFRLAG
ncbi:MAG TPA: UDP-N-acetylglucosamine 2-epimerase (non-hydrolyzing) [Terriglobia bacterium]|jgi:UDP-N-acetylglucosamine 2-epimerase (non-hydrolysing)|nr:UDP-N-acetylglucosamine 2-epimerase (non-hydrolyzing) [Terriglobia bacterium]